MSEEADREFQRLIDNAPPTLQGLTIQSRVLARYWFDSGRASREREIVAMIKDYKPTFWRGDPNINGKAVACDQILSRIAEGKGK